MVRFPLEVETDALQVLILTPSSNQVMRDGTCHGSAGTFATFKTWTAPLRYPLVAAL